MSDMVFRFPAPGPEPMLTDLEGWTKVEGNPTMKTWVQHTSIDGSVISGTGIGLTICKRLANLVGADVSFDSTPGKGSCFTLSVPSGN